MKGIALAAIPSITSLEWLRESAGISVCPNRRHECKHFPVIFNEFQNAESSATC
jgi:hypothetical protein